MSTDWTTLPMLAFDTETTGVNAHEDRIVTACIVEFQPGQRPKATNWLINPGIDIPPEATAVHGISTEHAREHGRPPAEVLFEISGRLALWMGKAQPVVGFNATYDFTILEAENTRHTNPTLSSRLAPMPLGPVIDPQVLDKHLDPYRKANCPHCDAENKTLTGCCIHYGIPLIAAHTAESDAASAVRLARKILTSAPEFATYTPGGLHMAQKKWRHEQMTSLRSYFDKNGIEHDGCDPSFPVLPQPVSA